MAYRAGGGAYAVFLEWSRQHPQYASDKYVRDQWRSFANSHYVTAATLFDEVFRRFPGWKKPSERGADYAGPAEDEDWDSEQDDEAETDNSPFNEEALPLCPEPRPSEPYPLAALGSLQGVVEGIAEAVGCEPGLAAQGVLMTASLATVGIADIDLPKIGTTGLPLFFVTIARSSERKSSADRRAIRGVKDRVAELAREHKLQAKRHKDEVRIYAAAENQILKDKKLDQKKNEDGQASGARPGAAAIAASRARFSGHDGRGCSERMGAQDLSRGTGPDDQRGRTVRIRRGDDQRHANADGRHALLPMGLRTGD
jgi:Protein of unknown function (DUF3987)/Primase C terminal 2 (PriCT-2)